MKKRKKNNKRLTGLLVVIAAAVLLIALGVTMLVRGHFGNKELICDGIRIGAVDVGGLTQIQAEEKVRDFLSGREGMQVTIAVGENQVTASAGEMGLSYPDENFADDALAVGKRGNLWKRFQEIRKAESGEITYDMAPEVDEELLKSFVEQNCSVYDVKAKDSKLKMKNGALKATQSRTGQEVQVDETVELLKETLLSEEERDSVQVTAAVKQTEPRFTKEDVEQCTDLLGQYSTTYSTYQVERSSNVATAAGRINGTVVYPGETFSTVKVIKDRTEANGYKAAPEYSSGKVVEGIGGGVCQVSTTLYNAIINAELEIVERSPHSMVVGYVSVSRDAAISGDYKDFKFKNNLDYPVYIMGSASGGVLSFKVYGHETRPANREISFEPEITDTIEPGDEVVTEDASLPAGYRSVTQSAHVGYKAKLWKIVKVDGVQTDKILLNTSSYNASPQYVTVGKQEATPTPAPTGDAKKDTSKSMEKPKSSAAAKTTDKSTAKSTEKPKNAQTTTKEDSKKD